MSILNDKHITHILNEKEIGKLYSENFDTRQDENNLYFFMDYFPGGELANLFAKQRMNMKMDDIKLYLAEIICAIEFLHNHNIVYRDLKLENIVIDKNGHLRLVDFGFAKRLKKERTYTRWGTEGYIAPEIIKDFGHGLAADIWSLGILFCNMVSGITPNTKDKLKKVYMFLMNDIYAKDLINKMLNIHADNRPTIAEIKQHTFFKELDWKKVENREYKPYFVPKCDDFFDTQYFENTTPQKHKALYIMQEYQTASDKGEESKASPLSKKFNINLTQEMKYTLGGQIIEQKCQPLGDFKLYRINQLLRDF